MKGWGPIRYPTLLVILLLLNSIVGATGPLRLEGDVAGPVSDTFEGKPIDSIEIDNRNIYELEDHRYRGFLFRTANHLHIVTRRQIVRQELLFAVGDPLSTELLEETARNLRTRFPLNEAWVEVEDLADGGVLVRVVTTDQWSLIGGLRSISRDGNSTDFRVGFEERNLVGRAQLLSFDFFARETEPDYITTSYREPRVFGGAWALGLTYRSDPHNSRKRIQVSRPFYSLAQKYLFDLKITNESIRQRRYNAEGDTLSRWTTSGERVEFVAGYRLGPSSRKISIAGEYKYLHKQIHDRVVFRPEDSSAAGFPVDSTYHLYSLVGSYALQSFIVEKRIRGFGYTEDVTLGLGLTIEMGRAYRPSFRSYYYDLATVKAIQVGKYGSHLVRLEYSPSFWYKGSEQIRRQSNFSLSVFNNKLSWATWAFRTVYQSDQADGNLNLVLGGKSGLRGYPSEFAAGDRLHVLNLEGRFFTGWELLSVKIGPAVFMDMGQTWAGSRKYAFRRYNFSGGAGLRLSLENLRKGEIIRIDAVLVEGGEWEISFGSGQYF